ncbi:MAG TPA: hypothetical protein VKZ53_10920 [Candidatus Angelobacter sp.]|nr:hypothetical protein [Candidatus Angelobacter sp.]
MCAIKTLPIRRLAAICAAAACAYLSIASHFHIIVQQDLSSVGWGAPAPPVETFLETLIAAPGVLAGLPVIVAGLSANNDWLTGAGVVLSAGFFWYCVGWYIDCSRATLSAKQPPEIVLGYMKTLTLASAILFPLGVFAGFHVGHHFCAVDAPPYWSEMLSYSIVMAWITVGASCELLRRHSIWKYKNSLR